MSYYRIIEKESYTPKSFNEIIEEYGYDIKFIKNRIELSKNLYKGKGITLSESDSKANVYLTIAETLSIHDSAHVVVFDEISAMHYGVKPNVEYVCLNRIGFEEIPLDIYSKAIKYVNEQLKDG